MQENFCSQLYDHLQDLKKAKGDFDTAAKGLENGNRRIVREVYEDYKEKRNIIDSIIGKIKKLKYIDFLEKLYKIKPAAKPEQIDIMIGGKTKEKLMQEMKRNDISVDSLAKKIINDNDFRISQEAKKINLIKLSVGDLGFIEGATTKEIYKRAKELGLYLCTAETGPNLRLQTESKDKIVVAMKEFKDLGAFFLYYYEGQLKLACVRANLDEKWPADYFWVFSLDKIEN